MSIEKEIIARGIFIPGNVPSSKNSKEIGFIFKKAGAPATIFYLKNGLDPKDLKNYRPVQLNLNSSAATQRYRKEHTIDYIAGKVKFQNTLKSFNTPYRIYFKFFRDTNRKFDYINAAQIVQDMMVENGWITDDDCLNIKPYFGDYEVNKTNPGVLISVF